MENRRWRPRDPIDDPILWPSTPRYLVFAIWFLLAGSIGIAVVLSLLAPEQTMRSLRTLLLAAVAAAAWACLAFGWIRIALYVLAFGVWAFITGTLFFLGGIEGANVVIYPLIIVMVGWLVGPRAAAAMALMTVAASLGFVLADAWHLLPSPPPTPSAVRFLIQASAFTFSAFLVAYLVRSYRERLADVSRLGDELARRTSQVQARESDLRRAQSVARIGSWVWDLDEDKIFLSEEAGRIFGLPAGATFARDAYLSRCHAEDREAVDRAWQRARQGAPFDFEHRIVVDGLIRWVRQVAELESDASGAPQRAVGIAQDITSRVRAEEDASRFRAALDHSADMILLIDRRAMRYIDANATACRLLGYSREELLALGPQHVLPIGHAELERSYDALLSSPADQGVLRSSYLCKDGTLLPFESSRHALQDRERQLIVVVSRDIRERLAAENTLRASEEKFSKAFHVSPDSIALSKLDSGEFLEVNESFERLTGYTRAETVGRTALEVGIWTDPDLRASLVARLKAGEAIRNLETVLRRKDGGLRAVAVWLDVIELDGEKVMLTVGRDVTEHKKAEEERAALEAQLRQSQKMEAIGTLAGGIAHDFNNMIGAILGNARLARDDVGAGHPALESLAEIDKAARRARDLVQQILAFSRKQVLEKHSIALAPVVEEAVRLLQATLPAGVRISVHAEPELPNVSADPTQIQQVLVNLCTNAWHAMQNRPGCIDIRLAMADVDAALARKHAGLRPGRYLRLCVADTGKGMDAATLERIFEPFFTTKPIDEGTGLGLSVVHGIVQGHEGAIAVDSTPGTGTTFRLYFPAAEAPSTARVAAKAPPAAGAIARERRVLYLDDDEALVSLVGRVLDRQGYRASGYTLAQQALDAVREDPEAFDLVVTDYNMPGMSGLDVARELSRIRPSLPVAVTSGFITEELRDQASRAGVRHLINKPDTVDELCDLVRRLG
jgi:PAS domain S-box-containing protein